MIKGYVLEGTKTIEGIKEESYIMYHDDTLTNVMWRDRVYTNNNGDYIMYRDNVMSKAKIEDVEFYNIDGLLTKKGRGKISKVISQKLKDFRKSISDLF